MISAARLLGNRPDIRPGLPQIETHLVQVLLDHWLEIRKGRPMPRRRDIDPTAIFPCLSKIWLYRYEAARDDFVCELAGDEIQTAWNRPIKGAWCKELFEPAKQEILHQRWLYIMEHAAIMQTLFQTMSTMAYKPAERLTLPFSDDEGRSMGIVGITLYSWEPHRDDDKVVAPPALSPGYFDGMVSPE